MDFKRAVREFEKFINPRKRFERRVQEAMRNDFVNSIVFEENPFEDEVPVSMAVFDMDGNEVDS